MKTIGNGIVGLFLVAALLVVLIPLLREFFSVALWPVVIFTVLAITGRLVWFYTRDDG